MSVVTGVLWNAFYDSILEVVNAAEPSTPQAFVFGVVKIGLRGIEYNYLPEFLSVLKGKLDLLYEDEEEVVTSSPSPPGSATLEDAFEGLRKINEEQLKRLQQVMAERDFLAEKLKKAAG